MLRNSLLLLFVSLLFSPGGGVAYGQSGSLGFGPTGGFNFTRPTRFTPAQPTFSPNFRIAGRSGQQLNERQNQQFFGQSQRRQPNLRPQRVSAQREQQFVQQQYSNLRSLQSQLAAARVDTRIPTGHGGTFMNTLHFYQQPRLRR